MQHRTVLGEVALNKIVALPCCRRHAEMVQSNQLGGRRLGIKFPDGRVIQISPCKGA